MGRITSFSKQVIIFFLVSALIIRPTFAANIGGWTLGNPIAQGASAIVNGTKTAVINGANVIKNSTAKITPTATAVAKVLARGAAGYALSVAVEQLLGSVDWVLDPANNRIKYYEEIETTGPLGWAPSNDNTSPKHSTATAACKFYAPINSVVYERTDQFSDRNAYCYDTKGNVYVQLIRTAQPPIVEEEEKYLPLDVVAQQVISNAQGGDTNAQVATVAAAQDIINDAQNDDVKARPIVQQLDQNAQTVTAEDANKVTGQTKPNTQNPDAIDISLEFLAFCGWAPLVCEAAQTVISFPATLTEWWETANTKAEEWALSISEAWSKVKEEYYDQPEENTDTQLDLPDQSDPNINTDLSFGGSCPASRSVPVSFAGIHTEIEFSFQWFCEVASIAKPVVISISAFAAALIVAGVRTEDD